MDCTCDETTYLPQDEAVVVRVWLGCEHGMKQLSGKTFSEIHAAVFLEFVVLFLRGWVDEDTTDFRHTHTVMVELFNGDRVLIALNDGDPFVQWGYCDHFSVLDDSGRAALFFHNQAPVGEWLRNRCGH